MMTMTITAARHRHYQTNFLIKNLQEKKSESMDSSKTSSHPDMKTLSQIETIAKVRSFNET